MLNFENYMEKPYWKSIYDLAPTDLMRSYLEVYLTEPHNEKEDKERNEKCNGIEEEFTDAEWDFCVKYLGSIPMKLAWDKKREKKAKGENIKHFRESTFIEDPRQGEAMTGLEWFEWSKDNFAWVDPADEVVREIKDDGRKCDCCGKFTLDKEKRYDICPSCGWGYDPLARRYPEISGILNIISLDEARELYAKYGGKLDAHKDEWKELEKPRECRDGKYQCRCCGNFTLDEPYFWNICPICSWEDDDMVIDRPNAVSGANHMMLNEAKYLYKKYGDSIDNHKEEWSIEDPEMSWEGALLKFSGVLEE